MSARPANPVTPFLARGNALVLDGGLATELEFRGYVLNDALWSARLLLEEPAAIRRVHTDYLLAGADCITGASYQATIPGFMARGLSEEQAIDLLRLSVQLAVEARDDFWSQPSNRIGRLQPLVAASIGPYGAFLANGSEYTGDYNLGADEGAWQRSLLAFHRQRWHILAATEADLLACETIPSRIEAQVLAHLLAETPDRYAWFSFSCRDGQHVSDGSRLVDCLAPLSGLEQVAAVGVNCTPPRLIPSLIAEARQATDKPLLVYPNSGERYDAMERGWFGESVPAEFGTFSREWRKDGAALIGGCCRTRPAHIRQIRDRM
jgi:homocysteine S-methyltransferase